MTLDTEVLPGLFRPLILWLHVVGVLLWIGGLSFQALVLFPLLRRPEATAEHLRLGLRLEVRFRRLLWPAVGLVLFTGLVNLLNVWQATVLHGISLPPSFLGILSVKLAGVLGIVGLQAGQQWLVHPRRLAALAHGLPAQQLQEWTWRLSLVGLGLAAMVLGCAVLLRAS